MDEFEAIVNLSQPELGKFGEFLAKRYWSEKGLYVLSCHRNEIDFYVNEIPYDVKTTAAPLKKEQKYNNRLPNFSGKLKDGVRILRVAIYIDCVVLASNCECLQRLDQNKLMARWHEFHLKNGGGYLRVAPRFESSKWLEQQKQFVRDVCESRKLRARVMHRNGVATQMKFGKWGPNSLIPTNPNKEDLTVFLWTESETIHRVIAFLHPDIKKLPLHEYIPPNKAPIQTMNLEDFEQFRGKWCFISLEDFKKNFRFERQTCD
jgi:hypothetical protein